MAGKTPTSNKTKVALALLDEISFMCGFKLNRFVKTMKIYKSIHNQDKKAIKNKCLINKTGVMFIQICKN